jgi:hypothetical protein
MLAISLTTNAVQGMVVWTNAALIEELGTDADRLTASIRALLARHDRWSQVADELSDQLKHCRLVHIKQALGIER